MDGMDLISPRPEHVHMYVTISAVLGMGHCTRLAASHKFLLSCVGIRQLLSTPHDDDVKLGVPTSVGALVLGVVVVESFHCSTYCHRV